MTSARLSAVASTVPGGTPGSAVSIAALTETARAVLEGAFMPLWVRGEVSDFKSHRNGHWYFCLRDEHAQVRCVVWSRDQHRMPAPPDDGMQVTALGQLTVYPVRGEMQLSIKALLAAGDGLWRKALEQTRCRLDRDGLLAPDRKRPLPRFPRRIAVITSPSGAALHDIAAVAGRRNPSVEITVVPAKVQGDGAAEELCAAIRRIARWGGADLVIVARGGGAREDLWAFNDERLARSLATCPVPTVSAIGHEVDLTICDLVADLRAPTPSAAAEAAIPLRSDLVAEVRECASALTAAAEMRLARSRERMQGTLRELRACAGRMTEGRRGRLEAMAGRLHALSPLATLARGFAVARTPDGRMLTRSTDFVPGDEFDLELRDGTVRARASGVTRR